MLFCPDCGSIMTPKEEGRKTMLVCACGYSHVEKEDILMRESVKNLKKIEVVDEKQLAELHLAFTGLEKEQN